MKKSIIALAVAGAMTAPLAAQADATLYGKFEMRLVNAKNSNLEVQSDDFRLGIKGDADTNFDGVKAIYGYETEINPTGSNSRTGLNNDINDTTNLTVRRAFVGLTGDFGTVKVGRFANPAESVSAKVANWSESPTGFAHDVIPDFVGAAIGYQTANLNGFDFYGVVVAEGSPENTTSNLESLGITGGAPSVSTIATAATRNEQEDLDAFIVGGNYNGGGFSVSAAYTEASREYNALRTAQTVAQTEEYEYKGISASYDFGGAVNVAVAYQDVESGKLAPAATYEDSFDSTSILVSKDVNGVTLWTNFHSYDYDVNRTTGQYDTEFAVGAAYGLGGGATLDFEFTQASGENLQADNDIVSLGYTINF